MNRLKRSPLHGGVFAIAVSAVALLLTVLLRSSLEPDIFVLFLVAAWVSAWFYGRTGGLIATAASAVGIVCFFLRPDPASLTPAWTIVLRVTTFILLSGVVTWMTA